MVTFLDMESKIRTDWIFRNSLETKKNRAFGAKLYVLGPGFT